MPAVLALLLHAPAGAEVTEANLKMVGRSDLGGPAAYGDVTVVGNLAAVATDSPVPCTGGSVKVVDVKDRAKPRVVASITVPAGTTAADLDSLTVDTPAFTADLLAVALAPCAGGSSRTAFYDISEPAAPRLLGESAGGSSVSVAQRGDGRVVAVRANAAGVELDDVSDPSRAAPLGQWRDASADGSAGAGACSAAQLYDSGDAAVAVLASGQVFDIDLTDPSRPAAAGPAEGLGGPVGVLPLGNRTIAVVAEDWDCADTPAERGLRVLTLNRGAPPTEGVPVRYPGAHGPGRLVTSGALAYVAWRGAGLRVVDFGEVRARTVAQFVPAGADVVGVALLPEHIVVTDRSSGLYVLARPDEGGGRATFWSQFLSLLPYLGFAGVMAAMFLVPRALASRAAARSGSPAPSPVPAPVPRRPA